jgi:hypothetical protein
MGAPLPAEPGGPEMSPLPDRVGLPVTGVVPPGPPGREPGNRDTGETTPDDRRPVLLPGPPGAPPSGKPPAAPGVVVPTEGLGDPSRAGLETPPAGPVPPGVVASPGTLASGVADIGVVVGLLNGGVA